jgi:hypothetical protein
MIKPAAVKPARRERTPDPPKIPKIHQTVLFAFCRVTGGLDMLHLAFTNRDTPVRPE